MPALQITETSGQKGYKFLTADAGNGVALGMIVPFFVKRERSGYLFCDGSRFDTTKYPLLYAELGTDQLPDCREVGLKGAEKNTTYIFDSTETDPRTGQAGTQNHDVFTQGEFKDDQLQAHGHKAAFSYGQVQPGSYNGLYVAGSSNSYVGEVITGRKGDVTRGKSLAVYWYIKATSGLTEGQQDDVANLINEQRSYSTEEHWTGKYWIDGKKIYSKTFNDITLANSAVLIENVSFIVNQYGMLTYSSTLQFPIPKDAGTAGNCTIRRNPTTNQAYVDTSYANYKATITIEYTKTT